MILLTSLFWDFASLAVIFLFIAFSIRNSRPGNSFDNHVMNDLDFVSQFDFNTHEKERQCFSEVFSKVWSDKKGWLLSQNSKEDIEIFEVAYINRLKKMLEDQEATNFYRRTQFSKEGRKLFDSVFGEARKTFVDLSNFSNDEVIAENIKDETARTRALWQIEMRRQKMKEAKTYQYLELLK